MDGKESATVSLRVYNTLTRKKEVFEPIDPAHVRFYVCGPTVYDNAHIGNARPVVVFDVLYRLLKRLFPKVTYVRNITDVDDKINARAQETGETIRAITERTAKIYHDDMAALGALPPDIEPRATDHIERMISMIECLIASGHAYAEAGHVLFDVPSMPDYGRLSGRNRDEQIAGARVEVAPYKRDPADFVLWKPTSDDLPRWDSPWGLGRPGWHIECSAMSTQYLGETFDIHGGGQDLIFPHHENEIAQSCCATGEPFVRYWMHNGYLMVEGEKMSKSLGNFYTVHDLLDDFPGEAIRLTLLQTHYRQPLDFRRDDLKASKAKLDDFYGSLQSVAEVPALPTDPPAAFLAALSDDLNTPQALVELHALRSRLNTASGPEIGRLKGELLAAAALLGILDQDPAAWRRWHPAGASGLDDAAIEALIADREDARNRRDFAAADKIRAQLLSDGVVLEDGAGGTLWRRA